MDEHRQSSPENLKIFPFARPFSCFRFSEQRFDGNLAIHRLFSLGRAFDATTFVLESIAPAGLVALENKEIAALYPDYQCRELVRLSFWRKAFTDPDDIANLESPDLVGYAILKHGDPHLGASQCRPHGWHVFEAVFRKYQHRHNCVPRPQQFRVSVGGRRFCIPGVLYCQQNQLNKACAHVALRSALARLLPDGDISYGHMNDFAREVAQEEGESFVPCNGLSAKQMRRIFDASGVNYGDTDYEEEKENNADIRKDVPYQKFLYAGIESGCGGLLGFGMSGPRAGDGKHIIPFYGHTFNKDTWSPDADAHYFDIGGGVGYIPSESWTSSFIGHDDNFGANFCVPRLYVRPENVDYVVEFRHSEAMYGGAVAEAQALNFLSALAPSLDHGNEWCARLRQYVDVQNLVLRAVCVPHNEYVTHLREMADWENNREDEALVNTIANLMPNCLWIVEVSIPQLFPANERKLGEVVLNAMRQRDDTKETDYGLFLFARMPASFFVLKAANQYGRTFSPVESRIHSHVELITQSL